MCIVVWFSFSLSPHLYLSLFMPVSFFLHMSVSLSSQICLCLSLFIWLSLHMSTCGSWCVWLCVLCVLVCRCVLGCACCCGVCVQKRSRVYVQYVPVCTFKNARVKLDTGVLNVHTGFWTYTRERLSLVFSRISPLVSPSLFSSLSLSSHTSLFFSLALSARLSLSLVCSSLSFSCRHSKTITSCINYGSHGFN